MSINFNDPMNTEARDMLRQMVADGDLPEPVAMDERRSLFNEALRLHQHKMRDLARAAKQPVSVELNKEGEVKEMADGVKYKVTSRGWVKVDP